VAYVRDARGNQAGVETREHANGTKFLQTFADRVWTDNLLALPECAYFLRVVQAQSDRVKKLELHSDLS
jgi:Protein of unknown function (DUF3892)